jgi:hypothetical protein
MHHQIETYTRKGDSPWNHRRPPAINRNFVPRDSILSPSKDSILSLSKHTIENKSSNSLNVNKML